MTVLESTMKRNVCESFASLLSYRRSASWCDTRSPRYSTMRVPLRMRRSANAPRPWTGERRTSNRGWRAMSDRHRSGDGGMILVAHELEILEGVVEEGGGPAPDLEARRRERSARELQSRLLEMIQIEVAVAARPDELTRLEVALLGEHVGEQRIARDVERHAEEDVRAALIELTGQPAVRHVELEQCMARHEVHLLELADVPGADQDAAGVGVAAQLLERHAHLVDGAPVGREPRAPLLAVNRPQLAALIGPLVPDGDALSAQPRDIGLAAQKPEQLADDRA